MMHRALQADRAQVIGSPMEHDAALSRLRARQRRLLGRPQEDLQSLLAIATGKVASLVGRLERERNGAVISPELRAEIEKFERGPQGHRCPQDYGYKYVELADVSSEMKAEVRDGVQRAVNVLNGFPASSGNVTPPLPSPAVCYMRLARPGEQPDFTDHKLLYGLHRWGSATICIRADVPPRRARATAVHEVGHAIGGLGHPEAENFARSLVIV